MNAYEITFIVRPDLDDDAIDAVVDQVLGRIQTAGGEIVAMLPWNPARRRMAYPIKDYGDGVYITVTFRVDPQSIRDMENVLKLNERILRFLVVQASDQAVAQAQQRLQQRAAAAAAPPQPQPAAVGAPPASATAPPAETSPAAQVQTAADPVGPENAAPAQPAVPPVESAAAPEPVAATTPSAPAQQTEE